MDFEEPTVLHGNLLCSEVLLHGDGVIAPAFDTVHAQFYILVFQSTRSILHS